MKKKILSLLVATTMCLSTFVGCASGENEKQGMIPRKRQRKVRVNQQIRQEKKIRRRQWIQIWKQN